MWRTEEEESDRRRKRMRSLLSVRLTYLQLVPGWIRRAAQFIHELPGEDGWVILVRHVRVRVHPRQHVLVCTLYLYKSVTNKNCISHVDGWIMQEFYKNKYTWSSKEFLAVKNTIHVLFTPWRGSWSSPLRFGRRRSHRRRWCWGRRPWPISRTAPCRRSRPSCWSATVSAWSCSSLPHSLRNPTPAGNYPLSYFTTTMTFCSYQQITYGFYWPWTPNLINNTN